MSRRKEGTKLNGFRVSSKKVPPCLVTKAECAEVGLGLPLLSHVSFISCFWASPRTCERCFQNEYSTELQMLCVGRVAGVRGLATMFQGKVLAAEILAEVVLHGFE